MKKENLKEEFYKNGRFKRLPVYDLHGHMGSLAAIHFPFPDTDSMVREMDKSGIRMLVFCHHSALLSPDIGNRANIEAVRRYPERLRAYCGINPNYPEIMEKDLKSFGRYYKDVYVGLKFLSDYHSCAITDARYEKAWDTADGMGLMVLLHTWGNSAFNGPEHIRKVAGEFRNARILLGHSCHGEWDRAIALLKDFPNIYLELCAVLDERGFVEKMVAEAGHERIVFGTDFPWFSYNYYIGALLGADITDEARTGILSANAERLLSEHISLENA